MEQVIEEKIQLILPIIFRNVGPLLLRSGGIGGLLGGGGGTSTTNDDDDDFDDDDNSDTNVANSDGGTTSTRTGAGGRKVSISLPTFPPDTDDEDEEDTQSTNTNNDDKDKDEDNDVQSKDEPSTTAKSTDTTQVSITEKSIVSHTNPIQTSTKSTVTTIIDDVDTTMIELETTQPSSFSSAAPPLIRIDTTTSSINDNKNSYNYEPPTTTTIPSSSMMSTSQDDETTENVFGMYDTTDSIASTAMQNTDESIDLSTTPTVSTVRLSSEDDGILTFQESSTEIDDSNETTTELSDDDFARLIDIRSLKNNDLKLLSTNQDQMNVEITTILPENNVNTMVHGSKVSVTSTSKSMLSKKYLPISQNLVRRRKSVVLKRQHIH